MKIPFTFFPLAIAVLTTARIRYDNDEQTLINNIIRNRKRGKKHHIIVNAEGIGHSASMAKRIEAATGVETRATILGHMQRGGSPTCKRPNPFRHKNILFFSFFSFL